MFLLTLAQVVNCDGHLFGLDNRRLYMFKTLREEGLLAHRDPPNTVLVNTIILLASVLVMNQLT